MKKPYCESDSGDCWNAERSWRAGGSLAPYVAGLWERKYDVEACEAEVVGTAGRRYEGWGSVCERGVGAGYRSGNLSADADPIVGRRSLEDVVDV